MLFLTTSRDDAIDAAFQSRIHLTLQYPELDFDAKEFIWYQLLELSCTPPAMVDREERSRLAKLPLNGRHIRNIVKTASLLAKSQGFATTRISHIDTVVAVTQIGTAPSMGAPEVLDKCVHRSWIV
ncbi:hypothetical protein PG987_006005 [Apiospora arundinis]